MNQHPTSSDAMTGEALQLLLAAKLPGADVSLRDDTHKHALHNEMVEHYGAHFFVRIVWQGFAGMPRLARHKLVHGFLAEGWNSRQLHSVSLRLMTADEAEK